MDDWRRAAREQAGVVSRAQALAGGLTSRQVGWLVSSGRWVRLLRVEEAVLDVTASAARPRDAVTPVLRATQRRITTAARLRERLGARRAHPWRRLLTGVLSEVVDGVTSMLEREYLHAVERPHGLPRGRRQVRAGDSRRRRYRDVRYERWRLVVELDGAEAHLDEERLRDMERDNSIVLAHDSPLQYGWVDVADAPCRVAAQVAHALADRGWTGRPTACGPACTASCG